MRHTLIWLTATAAAGLILAGCGGPSSPASHPSAHGHGSLRPAKEPALASATSWTCATSAPPGPGGTGSIASSAQTMAGVTWQAAAQQQKGCLVLYRSAGSHWQRIVVAPSSSGGIASLTLLFVDPKVGWILAPSFPSAGRVVWALYHTSDGGSTWTRQPAAHGSPFPTSNMNLEMAFSSPMSGWLTGLSGFYYPPKVFVYHTADGGASWSVVSFSVPKKFGPNLQYANPPAFSDKLHGTMTVTGHVLGSAATNLTYTTANGGRTWTLLPGQ